MVPRGPCGCRRTIGRRGGVRFGRLTFDGRPEVAGGLSDGARIVARPFAGLREGRRAIVSRSLSQQRIPLSATSATRPVVSSRPASGSGRRPASSCRWPASTGDRSSMPWSRCGDPESGCRASKPEPAALRRILVNSEACTRRHRPPLRHRGRGRRDLSVGGTPASRAQPACSGGRLRTRRARAHCRRSADRRRSPPTNRRRRARCRWTTRRPGPSR